MNKKVYASTLKAIAVTPVTWIGLCAVIALLAEIVGREPTVANTRNFHESLSAYAEAPLVLAIPIFLSVIASVDILKDKKNRFRDILTVSGTSQWKYYCSKIAAYLSVCLAVSFVLSYAFFLIRFFQYDMLSGIDYSLAECLWLLCVRWIAYSIPVLTVYVSMSVCISLMCRSAAIGIVLSVAYAFAKYMIPWLRLEHFLSDYVYHIPTKIINYFYFLNTKAPPAAVVHVELLQVIAAYAIILAISGILFSAGYVTYKRMVD